MRERAHLHCSFSFTRVRCCAQLLALTPALLLALTTRPGENAKATVRLIDDVWYGSYLKKGGRGWVSVFMSRLCLNVAL